MTVGKSEVTPFKHMLINSIVGREAGIAAGGFLTWLEPPYVFIDANAGDGIGKTATPHTLIKHAKTIRNRKGHESAEVFLIERCQGTFEKLLGNICQDDAAAINGDSADEIPRIMASYPSQGMTIVIDPNCMGHMPELSSITKDLNGNTSLIVTMGVNASGDKRNHSIEQRKQWYKQIEAITDAMNHKRHNVLLVRMAKGYAAKHQWAYLIVHPRKWVKEVKGNIASSAKKAAKLAGEKQDDLFGGDSSGNGYGDFDYCIASHGEPEFKEMLDYLFLTKKEREAG